MPQFSILLVDDSKWILKALRRVFKPEGYKIHTAESANKAFVILKSEPIDLLIIRSTQVVLMQKRLNSISMSISACLWYIITLK